jgi:hypothetical protein
MLFYLELYSRKVCVFIYMVMLQMVYFKVSVDGRIDALYCNGFRLIGTHRVKSTLPPKTLCPKYTKLCVKGVKSYTVGT